MAAAAGAGMGDDANALDDAGRAQCRSWARRWLAIELDRKAADFAVMPPEPRELLANQLRFWTYDPELAPLREPTALESLPDTEREACRQLWDRLTALLTPADEVGTGDAAQSAPQPKGTTTPSGR